MNTKKYLYTFVSQLLVFCFVILFNTNHSSAQPASKYKNDSSYLKNNDDINDQQLEDYIETLGADEDIDAESLLERLNDYRRNPIILNKATYEQLADLQLLSPIQIQSILDYRQRVGNLIAPYELQAIPQIGIADAKRILPYLQVGALNDFNVPFNRLISKGSKRFTLRYQRILEQQQGYQTEQAVIVNPAEGTADTVSSKYYLGSPDKLFMRYRYNYGTKISYGITAEKDAGEQLFKGTQKKGFDFYSAHFYMRDLGYFKYLVLGDYEVRFGQGLVAFTGMGFGKGAFVMNIAKQGLTLRPYTSVNESNFFRGVASTVALGKLELTTFVSYKPIDANLKLDTLATVGVIDTTQTIADTLQTAPIDLDLDNDGVIDADFVPLYTITESGTGIIKSGYHRTNSEIDKKNTVNQFTTGANIAYKSRRWSVGTSLVFTKLNAEIYPQNLPRNLYAFSGDQLLNASIDYRYLISNFNFFGETAISDNGSIATLNGALIGLSRGASLSIAHRYYSPQYQSLYANAFGESRIPKNEHGLFMGAILSPIKNWTVQGYYDIYHSPWLKFNADAPSQGSDALLRVSYKPFREMEMYGQYTYQNKQQNYAFDNEARLDFTNEQLKNNLRYNLQFKLTKAVTLKGRMEYCWFKDGVSPTQNGYALMQSIIWKPLSFPLSVTTSFAVFETSGWNTRIYAYENDILGLFSVPPYYNRGTRFYTMLRYKIMKGMDIWARYAQTYYDNVSKIGTGGEQINGNTKSDIKLMLTLRY